MLRKTVIALAALAVVTAGSTFDASARGGGGGGRGGGMGGGMAHMGAGVGAGHAAFTGGAAFSRPSGVARFSGDRRVGFDRDRGFRDRGGRDGFRHRFLRDRFAFIGAPYGYDDGCYSRVWTRWGWRWSNVCY